MIEENAEHQTEIDEAMAMLGEGYDKTQPAVIIERPAKGISLDEKGLAEYKVWGWVKISANFIHHIRLLRGAKHAVWEVIALSIDENGECKLPLKDLANLAGYSRSEVSESLRELDEMGYLTIQKEKGKSNIYKPIFAARGENNPKTTPIQKGDGSTHPVSTHNHPSSSAIEKLHSTIKELKRVSIYIDWKNMTPKEATKIATLQLYKEATDFFPGSMTWEFVHNTIIKYDLTYDTLHKAAEAWALNRFKPGNIKGILEWAVNGIPKNFQASIEKRETPTRRSAAQSKQEANTSALQAMQFDEEGNLLDVKS